MSGFDSSDEENEENVRPIEPFRNHTLTMRAGTKYERERGKTNFSNNHVY